ncbi:MAG: sigma-70 family RNA polymerase sigma factor [Caldilineae bacterium]|nr:sigma-70 family RNA polymerase sigma factor [Chloroflexota bacterium]MCB9175827.1 sigma-70 family RNA polymerase sigma factor [Caldilineae bacterium]
MKPLSCKRARELIDDGPSPELMAPLAEHLEACPDCRAEQLRQRELRTTLGRDAAWPAASPAYLDWLRHMGQQATLPGLPRRPGLVSAAADVVADDTIAQYLREIGNIPLLDAEEEQALGERIADGQAARLTLENPARVYELTDGDLARLRRQVEEGDAARRALTRANGRLVVHIAKKFVNRGVPFQDLIQEGNLGLMRAVEKYDYRLGFKFSTYATWWIRQSVTRALADQSRTIRVPVHMSDLIVKISATGHRLEQELGREATLEEIAEALELGVDKVRQALRVAQRTISLERPAGGDGEAAIGDFIADENAPDPGERAALELLRREVREVIASMSEREAEVLSLRYGLADGRVHTLEEVGARFGVTRERIRQIETKALRRLRHPSRSNRLRDFLG